MADSPSDSTGADAFAAPPELAPLFEHLRLVTPGIPAHDLPRFVHALTVADAYAPAPEASPGPQVPRGTLTTHHHRSEQAYPGVERDFTVYVPQQFDGREPAALMVFQDGAMYLGPDVNAPAVLDSLIHSGEVPVTVAVFVQPGDRGPGLPIYGGADNRSFEYDSLGDRYARFPLDELLPQATRGLAISDDPAQRAICGMSSGAICAFTVAWEVPQAFGKVISHCGSYVDIRGGHAYPSMIRRAERKPIRVFLQTGEHDLNITFGHWVLANRTMAEALAYRGYDHQLVVGQGGHSIKHGGALFADTLRWLWREHAPAAP